MFKGVAGKVYLFAFDTSAQTPKTGDAANITCYVSKDGGAPAALTDTSASELNATTAKGVYVFDVSASETNADGLCFTAVSSTSNIQIDPVFTFPFPQKYPATIATGDMTDISAVRAAKIDNLDGTISGLNAAITTVGTNVVAIASSLNTFASGTAQSLSGITTQTNKIGTNSADSPDAQAAFDTIDSGTLGLTPEQATMLEEIRKLVQ